MQLKLKEQFVAPEGFLTAATNMEWSPDSKKLSVVRFDRQMVFFNENCQKWDQVQTRGIDHTKPSKDYIPLCQSHSHDSCYIAVGQSDSVVYVFNVGRALEKKAIQGRFVLHAPATAVCWLRNAEAATQCDILVGCQDGSGYVLNMSRKSTSNLFSFQCFAQLLQQKQVQPDGQPSASGSPVVAIHRAGGAQAIFVNENGVSALYDLDNPAVLRMVSRHQAAVTASALFAARNAPGKQFLVLSDVQRRVVVNAVETGQALASVQIKATGVFTAAAANPAGNGVLLAGPGGLQYVSLQSLNPFVVQHDASSSLELNPRRDGPAAAITAVAWRPDAACVAVAFSDGSVDSVVPSLSSFTYCGAEVSNVAPNKSQLRLRNFNSPGSSFPPGILELTLVGSSEVKRIRAYPKALFAECVRAGDWAPARSGGCYVVAYGEKSLCVYSFEADVLAELQLPLGQPNDRLYFDVGVKRVVVAANAQLGEFTVARLPAQSGQPATVFATVRQCCYASRALISCCPQAGQRGAMLAAHLGEDRQEFLITELSPPDDADDFTEPITVVARVKHSRIIDWVDISPSGRCVLIRDVSGAIMIYAIDSKQLIDLSPTLGNGMVLWAAPFDVIVAQEAPDMPVLVYYNPTDHEDKAQIIQVPQDGQGWSLSHIDSSQIQRDGAKVSAALYAVVVRQDQSKQLSMALDQDLLLFNMLLATREVTGAAILLTKSQTSNKNQWLRLCQLALEQHQFMVCSRCYAALGDLGLSKYSRQIALRLKSVKQEFESDFIKQTYCDAQVALLKGDLDNYDRLLVQCNRQQEAINIYRELHLHHRAENIAPDTEKEQLHNESIDWLIQTKQSTLAAQLKAQRGDFRGALELLMSDRAYLAAYELTNKIVQQMPESLSQHVVESLANSLEQSKHYLQAGNLCQHAPLNDKLRALSLYRRGGFYHEAIQLARSSNPNECVYIEKEWAEQLYQTGHFDQSVSHFIEARDNTKAVDAALKAGNYDIAERLLLETNVDNALELYLRLGEAKYLQNEVDSAVQWFLKADQALLAIAAYDSVGRFDDAVRTVQKYVPMSNAADVIMQEAHRLIKIEEKRQFNAAAGGPSHMSVSATNILSKMESMSSVHGVLAARDLLAAAGLYEQACSYLIQYKMYDQLVDFAREYKTANYADVLRTVADYKRQKGDKRGCAQLFGELATYLFHQGPKQASQHSELNRVVAEATTIYNEINLFEDSIQLCRQVGNSELLIKAALEWIRSQPNQFQMVAQQLIKLNMLDQTALAAVVEKMFDVALQLASQSSLQEQLKKAVWERQGQVLEGDNKLQEAEHAYQMAGKQGMALQMYIRHHKWVEAENVVNNMPMGNLKESSIKLIKEGRAQFHVEEGKFKEAEQLYIEMNQIDTMVGHYKQRQMWQEALRLAKQFDRRDLIIDVQEAFADKDQQINTKMSSSGQKPTLSEELAKNQINNQLKKSEDIIGSAVGFKAQLIAAVKQGGEGYLSFVLNRAYEISMHVLNRQISEDFIMDDQAIMGDLVASDRPLGYRAVEIAVTYLTKGVPNSVVNEGDQSKSTISPLMIPGANVQHLLAVCRAVLQLEFSETGYREVLQQELTRDGIYSRTKRMMLNYRTALMGSQKGQQLYQTNKTLSIPGDAQLSRCFDALHLLSHSAQTLNYGNTPQQLKEKCQITSSIVRYCDLVPVDRCLAMAGNTCKQFYSLLVNETAPAAQAMKRVFGGQAFVFLNRFMDVIELEGGQTTGDLDAADIRGTGIPWDVRMPYERYLDQQSVDEVRSFVMQMSVQNSDTDQELPKENCPHGCGCERWIGAVTCTKCKNISPICCITGQHVINHNLKTIPSTPACAVCGCYARPAPWNNWVQKTKSCPVCGELGNPMGR